MLNNRLYKIWINIIIIINNKPFSDIDIKELIIKILSFICITYFMLLAVKS